MKHVMKQALLGSVAITRKSEEDDPTNIVTKALADLSTQIDERLKKVEGENPDLKSLKDRLDDIEKKAGRISGKQNTEEQNDIERKALSHFARTGS